MPEEHDDIGPAKNKEDLAASFPEQFRRQNRGLKKHQRVLNKFSVADWLVATIGVIVFSQALSFGRWNEFTSVENNFNYHAMLLAGCGLGLMLIAAAALALHKRLERV